MWPQEEELPCRLRATSTLHFNLVTGLCGTALWHGIMINFILRMALAGWKMGHYMGIMELRETPLLIPPHSH